LSGPLTQIPGYAYVRGVTLNNALNYRTDGHYRTLNPNTNP